MFDYKIDYQIFEKSDKVGGRMESFSYLENDVEYFAEMGTYRLSPINTPLYDLIEYINDKIESKNTETGSNFDKIELTKNYTDAKDARYKEDFKNLKAG